MKLKITFTDMDPVSDALCALVEDLLRDQQRETSLAEYIALCEKKAYELWPQLKPWLGEQEHLVVEFDLVAGTAEVVRQAP